MKNIKSIIFYFLMMILFIGSAAAQNTVVSGTIVDSDGITWANGTWSAVLKNPTGGTVYYSGTTTPVITSVSGVLSSTGTFSTTVASNNEVSPSGTTWQFTFCPNASVSCSQLSSISITGATYDISSYATANITAPRFPAVGLNSYGYSNVEIYPVPKPGGFYFNVTQNQLLTWDGTEFTSFFNGGTVTGQTNLSNVTTLYPKVDIRWPVFGSGAPVISLTTSGSCTSNPTITITGTQSAIGTAASASGYCINGQVESYVNFPGGGYTSASCTITGGGTSGATCSVNLGTAGVGDPTNTNDSASAIQNAIDYAFKNGISSTITPSVYLPQGEYKISQAIKVPCDVNFTGDGPSASVLNATGTSENGVEIVNGQNHPDAWDCRGEMSGIGITAAQGHLYTATLLTNLLGTGYSFRYITLSGGGGRGFSDSTNTERQFLQNIEIDTVRWPMVLLGNENHVIKLNIAAPGISSDTVTEPDGKTGNYCWGANCSNGQFPSYNWAGGILEYASGNGTTVTFYIHSNSTSYPDSPISAGMYFNVTGTTGTSLNGFYQATSVTNNITSDPSGLCTVSNVCFEVQASSTVNGVATLTAPTTTATFTSGSYELTVASATNFTPEEYITGTGIAAGTRIQSVSGTTLVINQPTTSAQTGITITGAVAWTPAIVPTSNNAVDFGGANVQFMDGSIKALANSNCFQDDGSFGSSLSNFYCEGYPINGVPVIASTFRFSGDVPWTTLTGSLAGTAGSQTAVGVASTLWFPNYINDRNFIYTQSGTVGAELLIEPQDYTFGSTTPSAYVPGVEQGQYEIVWGYFTSGNQFIVTQRNYSGSTAPSGTTWPSGSIIAIRAASQQSYGTLTISHMHANGMAASSNENWSSKCNDQSTTGNVCGEYLIGSLLNGKSAFSTGQASGQGGAGGIDVMLINNEVWHNGTNQGAESFGQGFIKTVGVGGNVSVILGAGYFGTGALTSPSFGIEAMNGALYNELYINVPSFDGSYPFSEYHNLSNGTWYAQADATGGYNGASGTRINSYGGDLLTGSPLGAEVGIQFNNSYCYWDTDTTTGGHADTRFCMVAGPGAKSTPHFEMDTWNGTTWNTAFSLSSAVVTADANTTFTGNNIFSGTVSITNQLTQQQTGYSYFQMSGGYLYQYNSTGTLISMIDSSGELQGQAGYFPRLYFQSGFNGTFYANMQAPSANTLWFNTGSGSDHNADAWFGTVTTQGGGKTVYECATAGTVLPVGSLTTNASACGSTTDTGLRVP